MRRWTWVVVALLVGCGGRQPARTTEVSGPKSNVRSLELELPEPEGGAAPAPLVASLQRELDRVWPILKDRADPAPYFMSYQVSDYRGVHLAAENGALVSSSNRQQRWLDVDIRVGGHELDNRHPIDEGFPFWRSDHESIDLPLTDDDLAIRTQTWLATDREYRQSAKAFAEVKAAKAIKTRDEDDSPDFSIEPSSRFYQKPAAVAVDTQSWEARLRRYSALLSQHEAVHDSSVSLDVVGETRYFVSSEGTQVQVARTWTRLSFVASTTAEDGMVLERHESLDAPTVDLLPGEDVIAATASQVVADIAALRAAPVAEPYEGPALLDGEAAGVFFHEVFGHRIEGHRQKDDEEGQTFALKIGERVMPEFISIFDDPRVARANETFLAGRYSFDDEGVPASRANLVRNGVLETFLLSRTPTRGFAQSNGHGRRAPGNQAVARQGNLFVAPSTVIPRSSLDDLFLQEIHRQGKPYRSSLCQGRRRFHDDRPLLAASLQGHSRSRVPRLPRWQGRARAWRGYRGHSADVAHEDHRSRR